MAQSLEVERRDADYDSGTRYDGDAPVDFISSIISELGETGQDQMGLYIGCGNGRNYIPLLDAGLNIYGIDYSEVAVRQLQQARPEAKVRVADFREVAHANFWDYLIALQVFQHGNKKAVDRSFNIARSLLRPGGKLFLRVNSASTEPYYSHHVTERRGTAGSTTVVYEAGPKEGMEIHFFTKRELGAIAAKNSFAVLTPPYETVEQRKPPQTGTWIQWDTIWQKK